MHPHRWTRRLCFLDLERICDSRRRRTSSRYLASETSGIRTSSYKPIAGSVNATKLFHYFVANFSKYEFNNNFGEEEEEEEFGVQPEDWKREVVDETLRRERKGVAKNVHVVKK